MHLHTLMSLCTRTSSLRMKHEGGRAPETLIPGSGAHASDAQINKPIRSLQLLMALEFHWLFGRVGSHQGIQCRADPPVRVNHPGGGWGMGDGGLG